MNVCARTTTSAQWLKVTTTPQLQMKLTAGTQRNDCRYWTWYKDDPRANECVTKPTHDDFKSNNNAVSGDKNCEGNKP